jgi:hypothetical protein
MESGLTTAQRALVDHVTGFFAGRDVEVIRITDGPIEQRAPGFRVVRVAPERSAGVWTYVSCGTWDAIHIDEHGLEFCMVAPDPDRRHELLLAMTAYYHANPDETYRLDHGHTVALGEPWVPGGALDHLLVSLPYPYGQEFEMCRWEGGHARILWLLPITERERDFKAQHGLEALERRFEDAGIHYWDPHRSPVV